MYQTELVKQQGAGNTGTAEEGEVASTVAEGAVNTVGEVDSEQEGELGYSVAEEELDCSGVEEVGKSTVVEGVENIVVGEGLGSSEVVVARSMDVGEVESTVMGEVENIDEGKAGSSAEAEVASIVAGEAASSVEGEVVNIDEKGAEHIVVEAAGKEVGLGESERFLDIVLRRVRCGR